MSQAKFNPGQIVSTNNIAVICEAYPEFSTFVTNSMRRHLTGDWGDLDNDDKHSNNEALACPIDRIKEVGDRILSAYNFQQLPGVNDTKIWIITEHDRSVTTILFPSEY